MNEAKQKALELIERGEGVAVFFFPNERGKEAVKLFARQYALELVKFHLARIDEMDLKHEDSQPQRDKWFAVQQEFEKIKNISPK